MTKQYARPAVLAHERIQFETAVSKCNPPSFPVNNTPQGNICVHPDQTWDPMKP